ncbi:MAG TPA: cyclic nucleotide-binding domain-containing protein [Terriglobales bacterium]|nr:cyclic nucleotide-binding domain-containing protein [Terriglobales bacterium]
MRRELPSIGPMERALHLRALPLFSEMRSSDLAACAQLLEEVRFRRQAVLYGPGEGVPSIYLLVEGQVQNRRGERLVWAHNAPDIAGLVELLASYPHIPRGVAATRVLALALDSAALLDLIEDHFPIYLETRRALGAELAHLQQMTADYHRPMCAKGWGVRRNRPLDPAERLLLLQRLPIFHCVGLGVLVALLRDDAEVRFAPGERLWQQGDEADWLAIVIAGSLVCQREGQPEFRIEAGDAAGIEAVFTGMPHRYGATAESQLTALRIDTYLLVDLAEDNFDLAQCTLAHVAREILRLRETAAGDWSARRQT